MISSVQLITNVDGSTLRVDRIRGEVVAITVVYSHHRSSRAVTRKLKEVRATVATLAERGVDVTITAVVKTLVDPRRLAYQAILEALPSLKLPIANTEIPMLAAFDNSVVLGQPLVVAEPSSAGALAYRQLAAELSTPALRPRRLAAVN